MISVYGKEIKMSSVDEVFKYVISKWYVVLICAILGSGALYVEKSQVAPAVAISGDQLYTRLARFEPMPVVVIGNETKELDLKEMMGSKRMQKACIDNIGAQLDFEKICAGWNKLNLQEQLKWYEKHITIKSIGAGMYELEVHSAAADAKDASYVRDNSDLLMDIVAQTVESETAAQTGNAKLVTVEEKNFVDLKNAVPQNSVQRKYAIIGFILGAFVGLSILAVLSLRKKA